MNHTEDAHGPVGPSSRGCLWRSRWAAIGAAVAVTVGGGGLFVANAAGPSTPSSTVTIDPCRFVDTRDGGSPIGANDTVTFGAFGVCGIPASATALVANVTVVDPSLSGFLTVFAADVPRPATSTLNWDAGTDALANQAMIALSATGKFSVYNMAGSADLVIDVSGYMLPASTNTGAKGDTGAAGTNGIDGTDGINGDRGEQGEQGEIGPQGDPGSANSPIYSYSVIDDSTPPYVQFDLGVELNEIQFWALCTMQGGNIDAAVMVWDGTFDALTVVREDGTTVTLSQGQDTTIASGSYGSPAGLSSSIVLTTGQNAWEANNWIDIDPSGRTCKVHSTITTLVMATAD